MARNDRVNEEEARAVVAASAERFGPQVIEERADALHGAMVVENPVELNYLAGRIALTLEETQIALGIGERTLRTALRNGEIPSVKIGARRLVPVKALERHLEALAYASSGALDAWEAALIQAATNRLRIAKRRAWERRKHLRRQLVAARKAGLDHAEAGRDYLTQLRADLAELQRTRAVTERFARDFEAEIDAAEETFGLTEEAMAPPGLGLL